MKKFLRRLAIWSGILLLVFVLLLTGLAFAFEGKIGKQIVSQVNKQLKTELKIEDFNLSLLSGFPNASAELTNVELEDAFGNPLLKAEELAFRLSVFSLFGSKINVKSIVIKNGILDIVKADRKGKSNYDIFIEAEEEETKEEGEGYDLAIGKALLENVVIRYLDAPAQQKALIKVENATVSGKFDKKGISIKSDAEIDSEYIQIKDQKYFPNTALFYDLEIDMNTEEGIYTFNNVNLGLGSNIFRVNGTITDANTNPNYDLQIENKAGNLTSILALMPNSVKKSLEGLSSKGKFLFDAKIKGTYTASKLPSIDVQFGLRNGKLMLDKLAKPIKDVTFNAYFSNGDARTMASSIFEISNFKGYFNRELMNLELRLANLDDPTIRFKADGAIPMESIYPFFGMEHIKGGSGEIEFNNVSISGKLYDMLRTSRVSRVKANGMVEFDDTSLKVGGETISIDRGAITFDGNNFMIDNLKFVGPGTEIHFKGECANLIPVLLADSLNTKNAELRFNAGLIAPQIDLDALLALNDYPAGGSTAGVEGGPKTEGDAVQEEIVKRERITNFLKGTFKAKIDKFNYREIESRDFTGNLTFDNNELIIDGSTNMMGGAFKIEGRGYFEKEPYLNARLFCDKVNVKEFFRQTENFAQDVLVDKNLKGNMDAKIAIQAFWDEEGNFLMDDLHVISDFQILDGELADFKMLYAFSDVIKLKDLRRIKFAKLHNWLEIKDGKLVIPVMFIQSSAMNLTISGEHSFENEMRYNFKVNAGQILAQKLKKHNPDLELQEAKKKGFLNLYYKIFGTVENYQIKSDKKGIKKSFELSENDKQRLRNLLVQEFGSVVILEEPPSWKDEIPEYEEEEDDGEEEFLDGF